MRGARVSWTPSETTASSENSSLSSVDRSFVKDRMPDVALREKIFEAGSRRNCRDDFSSASVACRGQWTGSGDLQSKDWREERRLPVDGGHETPLGGEADEGRSVVVLVQDSHHQETLLCSQL